MLVNGTVGMVDVDVDVTVTAVVGVRELNDAVSVALDPRVSVVFCAEAEEKEEVPPLMPESVHPVNPYPTGGTAYIG